MQDNKLMKKRWLVIADYPDMDDWKLNEILVENWSWYDKEGNERCIGQYPH